MTMRALVISVRLLAGRFHGNGDWPPSPFRLFQALVAGAYGGRWQDEERAAKDRAFRWLECLPAPLIAAPARVQSCSATYYVPNNDVDTVGGDPSRIAKIRVAKTIRASLFDPVEPLLYAWPFDAGQEHAQQLAELASRLHTLGHGVDAAAAEAEILDWPDAERRLAARAALARPTERLGAVPCTVPGSLESLQTRNTAFRGRFIDPSARGAPVLFRQPPKPLFRGVAYDRPPTRRLFDLLSAEDGRRFALVPQVRAAAVAAAIRDLARGQLERAMPGRASEIARVISGIGAGPADLARRVRFIPLPTIGFDRADPAIRRVLVEIPPDCPVVPEDLDWALAGRALPGFAAVVVTAARSNGMLRHYGVDAELARRWRSVTPVALPLARPSGRSGGASRVASEQHGVTAVLTALRHAGYDGRGVTVRLQREPLHLKGERAEEFEAARFDPARLHHVELCFPWPIQGPLVLGDGRWLGLGLMRPVRDVVPALQVFALAEGERNPPLAKAELVTRALRRAVMARVARDARSGERLPSFFTGHDANGRPLRNGMHQHLFFAAEDADGDGRIDRVLVVAPHLADRTTDQDTAALQRLQVALERFDHVRVGPAECLRLHRLVAEPIRQTARVWHSHVPYRATRHPNGGAADRDGLVAQDIANECSRRGLPRPEITVDAVLTGPRGGLLVRATLTFRRLVTGPMLLGRRSHFGQGLFRAGLFPPDGPVRSC